MTEPTAGTVLDLVEVVDSLALALRDLVIEDYMAAYNAAGDARDKLALLRAALEPTDETGAQEL